MLIGDLALLFGCFLLLSDYHRIMPLIFSALIHSIYQWRHNYMRVRWKKSLLYVNILCATFVFTELITELAEPTGHHTSNVQLVFQIGTENVNTRGY